MRKTIKVNKTSWVKGLGFTTWQDKVNYKRLNSQLRYIANKELPFGYKSNWIDQEGFINIDLEEGRKESPKPIRDDMKFMHEIVNEICDVIEGKIKQAPLLSKTNSNIWI